jgi:hypothetical protein
MHRGDVDSVSAHPGGKVAQDRERNLLAVHALHF